VKRTTLRWVTAALATLAALAPGGAMPAAASSQVRGTEFVFRSPNGVTERCVALDPMPGGLYTAADSAEESRLCAIDLHRDTHALCPKLFSTSPGTLIYELAGGVYAGNREGFERSACSGGVRSAAAAGEPISFKMSVNTRESSATYANASLVYYHLARYFHATAHVPVAVLRTIDRTEHVRRVSSRGVSQSADRAALRMNHAAWQALWTAGRDPSRYEPSEELFTPDGLLYGVMLHPLGKRYGEELDGTRQSGWGDGQNRDFQETAPFRALRSEQPLAAAIEEGRRLALQDPKLAAATRRSATPQQMVYWMSDLVDITLLDFLCGQQDRIGNIDYVAYWYWVQDGTLNRRQAASRTPPAELAAYRPVYLQRTELGDNDAGLRTSYLNYAQRTGMLEKLRHHRADAYRQLLRLEQDFAAAGPLHAYVSKTFGLSEREFAQLVANTKAAASILRESCRAGRLRFDLEPEEFLRTGTVRPREVACDSF